MFGKVKTLSWLLSSGFICLLFFQNCGEVRPLQDVMKSQASEDIRIRNDRETLRWVFSTGNLKLLASAKEAEVDAVTQKVVNVPADILSTVSLTSSGFVEGPALVSFTSGMKLFSFLPSSGLSASQTVSSTSYSLVLLVFDDLNGKILSISSGTPSVEEAVISVENGVLIVTHHTTANDYTQLKRPLESKAGMRVIAVSFTEAADGISVLVDGQIVRNPVLSTGDPASRAMMPRTFTIGSTDATFKLVELMALSESLRPSELNSLSRYVAGKWGYSGVIYDPTLEPEYEVIENPDMVPMNIMSILERKCTVCHTHANWVGLKSFFVSSGLLVPGNYLSSKLYNRLVGSEGTNNNKNMPVGGSMDSVELEAIKNWIQSL